MSNKPEIEPATPIQLGVIILKCAAIYAGIITVFLHIVGWL